MTISRRQLYEMGEPLGDSTTTAKLGGGYVCGFGGSSSSRTEQNTFNTDRRVVTNGGLGWSGDIGEGANVRVETSDPTVVSRALQTVEVNNATNAEGFGKLLEAATDIFNRGQGLIGQTQAAVADAYTVAQNTAKGTIDNRTITVLAVAGVAAVWAINRKK